MYSRPCIPMKLDKLDWTEERYTNPKSQYTLNHNSQNLPEAIQTEPHTPNRIENAWLSYGL